MEFLTIHFKNLESTSYQFYYSTKGQLYLTGII